MLNNFLSPWALCRCFHEQRMSAHLIDTHLISNSYSDYQEIETIVVLRGEKRVTLFNATQVVIAYRQRLSNASLSQLFCVLLFWLLLLLGRPHSSHVFCIFILFCWSMRIFGVPKIVQTKSSLGRLEFCCIPLSSRVNCFWMMLTRSVKHLNKISAMFFISLLVTWNDYCGMNSVCQINIFTS